MKYFAEKVCLSPNYFGDLVKSETGKSPHELIQFKIAEIAKSALLDPKMNTKQVADMLGFQYPQHFLRFFKKKVGCTPKEYRTQNNLVVNQKWIAKNQCDSLLNTETQRHGEIII